MADWYVGRPLLGRPGETWISDKRLKKYAKDQVVIELNMIFQAFHRESV